jgi:hypothetical protein
MEEVRWNKEGTVKEDNCTFSMEKEINYILKKLDGLDGICLSRDWDQWQALVYWVMNFRVI